MCMSTFCDTISMSFLFGKKECIIYLCNYCMHALVMPETATSFRRIKLALISGTVIQVYATVRDAIFDVIGTPESGILAGEYHG